MKTLIQFTIASAMALAALAHARADTLEDIKAKGKIVVGVKADYRPYGFMDPSGAIVGLEPDLARNVAERLGVELELVPVIASNRIQFLQQGKVDLLIATMANTPERRSAISLPAQDYYASYAALMTPKGSHLRNWEELKGKPVCAVTGGFYNQSAGEHYGAQLIAYKGTAEAFRALSMGSCVGFLYDDTFLTSELQKPEWSEYKLTLPLIDPINWAIGVRKDDHVLTTFMNETIVDWHRTGFILNLEKTWNIPATPFATQQHAKLQ